MVEPQEMNPEQRAAVDAVFAVPDDATPAEMRAATDAVIDTGAMDIAIAKLRARIAARTDPGETRSPIEPPST